LQERLGLDNHQDGHECRENFADSSLMENNLKSKHRVTSDIVEEKFEIEFLCDDDLLEEDFKMEIVGQQIDNMLVDQDFYVADGSYFDPDKDEIKLEFFE